MEIKIGSKIKFFRRHWTVDDVQKRSHMLFVYGDNDAGIGKGGQAIIRGLPNTIGVPTKKYPSHNKEAYYTDSEYKQNVEKINDAFLKIIELSKNYKYIVFSADGLGTGLSDLPNKAPKTLKYINQLIKKLKRNEVIVDNGKITFV